ncbi:MAG: ISNCY family transposase [Desulfuromonadales bacterium]|nr:ISNCY family transposase [Desulfuromonadales bacterium]
MAGKDLIVMSIREVRRLKAVQTVIEGHITQKAAASLLGLSERQVRRLVKAVREQGDGGIIHGLRGRSSNRGFTGAMRGRVLSLYKERYVDFGPTFAVEKLLEWDGIKMSDETLRKWLLEAGLWKKRRKKSPFRRWRPRRECFGELLQLDGSHHDWLEGRGPRLVFMGSIDDATNTVYGRFHDYEGTLPAMDVFRRYVEKYGLPMSSYMDRHTTYKSSKKLTEWDEVVGCEALSQFERALKELGVEVIHALSPQAKGRIERLFGVLQDRLVKEMRLRGIGTKEEANTFLEEYLPQYNKRFTVYPAHEADVHVKLPAAVDLDEYLCIKTERTVRNDNTIALNGKLYQLEERGGKKVLVQERLDGSLRMVSKGVSLKHREITERPKKQHDFKENTRVFNRPPKPAKDHPWKKSWKNWMPARASVY